MTQPGRVSIKKWFEPEIKLQQTNLTKLRLSKYIIASLKIVAIKCVYLLLLQEKMCEDIYQKNKNCQGPTEDQHRDF